MYFTQFCIKCHFYLFQTPLNTFPNSKIQSLACCPNCHLHWVSASKIWPGSLSGNLREDTRTGSSARQSDCRVLSFLKDMFARLFFCVYMCNILWNHFNSWGPVFMDYQFLRRSLWHNFKDSLVQDFVSLFLGDLNSLVSIPKKSVEIEPSQMIPIPKYENQ